MVIALAPCVATAMEIRLTPCAVSFLSNLSNLFNSLQFSPSILPGSLISRMYLETGLSTPLIIASAMESVTALPALGPAVEGAAVAAAIVDTKPRPT